MNPFLVAMTLLCFGAAIWEAYHGHSAKATYFLSAMALNITLGYLK